jgi:glycosyltransferase involved in cell wall biosynthesis
MTRICFFTGGIDRSGGTERVTTVIASALAERGHEVCILSTSKGRSSFFPLHPAVELHSLCMEHHSANLSDWRVWWRLRRFILQHRIERLIDVDTVLSWCSIPAAWGTSARVISWEHFHLLINLGDVFQRLRRSLGRRMALRWAHKVITLTDRDRQQYLSISSGGTKILAIPNPVTIQHGRTADPDSKVVLAAGRLVPQKGFDLLLQAWAQVWPACPQWMLRIVGSGSDGQKLQLQAEALGISQGVEFVPNTSDMPSEYQRAALFVCSSRFEGFGLVLVEAKAFGLPVVSFDCACGPSDIVRNGVDGLLVSPEDPRALAQALVRLINDPPERRKMGLRALEDRRFDLDGIVQAWERVLA